MTHLSPSSTPPGRSRNNGWLWLLLIIWVGAGAVLIFSKWRGIVLLSLPDTDDNMRLQQVRDWLAGQAWFDLRQHRMDPPAGADIHWSRLVDLPLAGLILAGRAFLSVPMAERLAVAVAPLLPLLAAMLASAGLARRVIGRSRWLMGPALLLCASSTLGMMSPLRIDHHGWQIALVLLMVLGLLCPRRAAGGVLTGLCVGLSLAIGVETLPYLGLAGLAAALGWIGDPREGPRFAGFGAAACLSTGLAWLLFVPPPARILPWCDVLSLVWLPPVLVGGAGATLLGLLPLRDRRLRLLLVLLLGAVAAALVLGLHPSCLLDPYSAVDSEARRLWLNNVREARPIYQQSGRVQVTLLSLPVAGLVGVLLALWRTRRQPEDRRNWIIIAGFSLFALALTLTQTRANTIAQALAVPGAAWLAWQLMQWARRWTSMPVRLIGVVLGFMIASGLASQYILHWWPQDAGSKRSRAERRTDFICGYPPMLHRLNRYPAGTMLSFVDLGPRLVVHSHHAPLVGPYHRNGRVIAEVMKAWAGTTEVAHATVRRHHVRYVMLCPGTSESTLYRSRAPQGFYMRLTRGEVPGWLLRLPLPPRTPYRLYRVRD